MAYRTSFKRLKHLGKVLNKLTIVSAADIESSELLLDSDF